MQWGVYSKILPRKAYAAFYFLGMSSGIDVAVGVQTDWYDSTAARKHMNHQHRTIDKLVKEIDELRKERRDREEEHKRAVSVYEAGMQSTQVELESKRISARKNKCALVSAKQELDRLRGLEDALSQQKDLNAELKLRVRKLEQVVINVRAQRAGGRLASAIEKLAKSPAVGRRLAAACHPDKVPAECNDLAVELFRFVQGVRDSNSS